MVRYGLCIVLMMASVCQLSGQNRGISDSLYQTIRTSYLPDTLLLKAYLDLGYYESSPVRALENSMKALELAKNLEDQTRQGIALELIGANHRLIGNKTQGFESSFEALAIYRHMGDLRREIALLVQIGTQYTADDNYTEGVKYLRRSLKLYEQTGNKSQISYTRVNLGETYRLMDRLDSALYYHELVLNDPGTQEDPILLAYTEGNTGMILHARGELIRAETLLTSAIQSLKPMGDLYSASIYQADLGELRIKQGETTEGLLDIQASLDMAISENLKEQIRDFSMKLSAHYAETGDYRTAYQHHQQYAAYRDSLVNADNIRSIAEIRYGFELDQQEQKAQQEQEKNRARLQLILIIALALLLVSVVLFRSYRRKQRDNALLANQNQIIQAQADAQETLHKELHHRVKNNLQLIGSMMTLQSARTPDANVSRVLKEGRARVDALMLIHQNLYHTKNVTHVDLKDYLERLVQNLQVTYRSEAETISSASDEMVLRTDEIIPLGLIVNEVIANSVKHRGSQPVNIRLAARQSAGHLKLEMSDDGPGGFELERSDGQATGFGTQLIKNMVRQMGGEIEATSSKEGTKIMLNVALNSPLTS